MSVSGNLNYIRKAFRHPCGTPNVSVMVETFAQAAVPNLLKLALFGCSDIAKMKIGKAPWHSRALKGFISQAAPPQAAGARRWLFSMPYNAIEAALWYWLVAEAGTSFAADWMSLMYQEQDCKQPGAGYLTAGLSSLYLGPGTGYQMLINGIGVKQCCIIGGNKITIPGGCSATISYRAEWTPFLGKQENLGTVTTWLQDVNSGKGYSLSPGNGNANQTTGGGFQTQRGIVGVDRQYIIQFSIDRGLMGCSHGELSVSGYGRKIPLIPAGCNPKPNPYSFGSGIPDPYG